MNQGKARAGWFCDCWGSCYNNLQIGFATVVTVAIPTSSWFARRRDNCDTNLQVGVRLSRHLQIVGVAIVATAATPQGD